MSRKKENIETAGNMLRPTIKDLLITLLLLAAATGIGLLFNQFGFSESNIITVFILGVLIISVVTLSPLYGALGSLASVLLFNWFFIDPRYSFHTYEAEYPVTFAIMLISSLITGTLANRIKSNAMQSAREAFRTKILLETNQLLQKADKADDVVKITEQQIRTLLNRDVTVYSRDRNMDGDAAAESGPIALKIDGAPMEPFENNIVTSMLGECALALENLHNAEEKERASVMVKNEQLRSNLLRAISHDIRSPLTSISGNASNLISHYSQLDNETREQIFSDIYNDAEWLIELVENLLSISRIENGRMELHMSSEILSDVIDEAIKHIDRKAAEHVITVKESDDILLVDVEARLIMQVLINLVNNAIKNTPVGSEISVETGKRGNEAVLTVRDNGPGIPDEIKKEVFELFYTGQEGVADGRRSLGLGLALCRSIAEAHHGNITLSDNLPHGCCFTVSLPLKEVQIDE